MLRLTKDELKFLANLESVNSISSGRLLGDEIVLHSGKNIGMYVPGHGVVLQPIYAELMRFDDLIKVGQQTEEGVRYGAYSIAAQTFVIPIMYTDRNPYGGIWEQIKLHLSSL